MDPAFRIRKPKINNCRTRVMEDHEEARLRTVYTPARWSQVIFAINTGIRKLEQWRLKKADLQFFEREGQRVGLAHIVTSKTGKGRMCPLNPVAANIAWCWVSGQPGDYLFSYRAKSRPSAADYAGKMLHKACVKLGVVDLRWHDLRRTCATRAAANGARPEEIQKLLGHETLAQTEDYIQWGDAPMWRAAMSLVK